MVSRVSSSEIYCMLDGNEMDDEHVERRHCGKPDRQSETRWRIVGHEMHIFLLGQQAVMHTCLGAVVMLHCVFLFLFVLDISLPPLYLIALYWYHLWPRL